MTKTKTLLVCLLTAIGGVSSVSADLSWPSSLPEKAETVRWASVPGEGGSAHFVISDGLSYGSVSYCTPGYGTLPEDFETFTRQTLTTLPIAIITTSTGLCVTLR